MCLDIEFETLEFEHRHYFTRFVNSALRSRANSSEAFQFGMYNSISYVLMKTELTRIGSGVELEI